MKHGLCTSTGTAWRVGAGRPALGPRSQRKVPLAPGKRKAGEREGGGERTRERREMEVSARSCERETVPRIPPGCVKTWLPLLLWQARRAHLLGSLGFNRSRLQHNRSTKRLGC